ncbi:hypothetical protein Pmar_PMAR010269 [Perkinsus marinus ATCC 50983]|uniref:Uncharacterized protein n=1 Tax=Perkinsus marinus (strain ATCC 50983 / TXsc) TaxID=423536 RepID=C5K5A1_PERM5|nr:hypothetical protein Pmar_PMAR010269 [Perkinsus marinus ATCC 50983]EER20523.1 hypothetical protein Pmar_PMAR010269 [Perkinsus marinus ATCC 50983]|eukprot:XP_002788727.1 hypothetical protein Pmar_PMAR010269 [Perkinsus marinus ATCC 50983]
MLWTFVSWCCQVAQRWESERLRSGEHIRESQLEQWRKICRQKQLEGVRTRMDDINTAVDEGRWRDSVRNNIENNVRQAVAGFANRWQSDLLQVIELLNAV